MLKRIALLWSNIRPKVYKRTLFFGKNQIIRFTSDGIKKFLFKLTWIVIVAVMLLSMILGGLAITQQSSTNTSSTIIR